jgi:ATP-binding cassette subfamily B protein
MTATVKDKDQKLSKRDYVRILGGIAKLTFSIAPRSVIFKLIGIAISATLPIVITYFAAQTITQLAEAYQGSEGAGRTAIIYAVIAAMLGLAKMAWDSIDQLIQKSMQYVIETKVSTLLYSQLLSLKFSQYDDKETADLYERAQKFSQFYSYVFDRISRLISDAISMIFALIAIAIFQPVVAAFVLIAVLPGLLFQLKLTRIQTDHWKKNVVTRRSVGYIEWNLLQPAAITELRLNGLVHYLMDLRQRFRDKDEKERIAFERGYILKRLLADGLESLTELGALIWVITQIIAREQPLGQFVYVQQLVSRALGSANGFMSTLSAIDEDFVYLQDYQKFMALKVDSKQGKKLVTPPKVIKVENISFKYAQSPTPVLDGISFEIRQGQHVAIVGENGAGKSTLIKLITGLYDPSDGEILLDDMPLSTVSKQSWHSKLSVLQQDFQQYIFTDVRDNVYFGDVAKPLKQSQIDQSLRMAEAFNFVDKLPRKQRTYPHNWMEDDDGNHGNSLSGGQWQRIALARNFYRNAPIIILDEPTSAIDALAEARIFDHLLAKESNKTVITVSHRLSTVELADHIIVLADGKVAEQGTHQELLEKKGEYVRLFRRQLRR